MNFVNRERELARLNQLANQDGHHLALVYGRRRIGKTYLLTHAWQDKALYFTASATSASINRRALLREAQAWTDIELRPDDHPTWRTLFRTLFELQPDSPLVVVLDEFQYLASDDEGLREIASELNAVWEGGIRRDAALLVVLSGSAVHTLRELESGGSPLYGRLDWRCRLEAFDYWDAAKFVDWPPRDKVQLYAAFGGTPKYLDAVESSTDIESNIVSLMLASDGPVRMQVETAIEQEEGLRDVASYRAVLASVGLKRPTIGEIAASMGRPKDNALKRIVKRLVDLGYLSEEKNFDAPRNQQKRYRLSDPAQRFYYGLVLPNESAIANAGEGEVWSQRLEPSTWPTYVGFEVFEDIVRQAYLRFGNERDLPAIETWGRWQGQDREGQDLEIDIVARALDKTILTGSIKFTRQPANAAVFLDHVGALQRLTRSGKKWAHRALEDDSIMLFVSAAGFSDSFHEVANEVRQRVICWDLSDIYPTGT